MLDVAHQHALGDFQFQAFGRQAGNGQGIGDQDRQAGLLQLPGR